MHLCHHHHSELQQCEYDDGDKFFTCAVEKIEIFVQKLVVDAE